MINFDNAISVIRDNHGFKTNNKDSSFYRTYTFESGRYIQIRISNHGTHLWTWLDRDYDPSNAFANISIVFSKNGNCNSNVVVDVGDKKRSYSVTQYVYNCKKLNDNDILQINRQIANIVKKQKYIDPLWNTEKRATKYVLKPNIEPQLIAEHKQAKHIAMSQLRKIIRESIKKYLNVI